MKKKIIMSLVLISIISSFTIIAIANNSCQHNYVFNSINNGNVIYKCKKCDSITSKNISEVKESWNNDFYNTNDNNSYLDLTSDDFINAKDYAKANNEYKSHKKTPSIDIGEEL